LAGQWKVENAKTGEENFFAINVKFGDYIIVDFESIAAEAYSVRSWVTVVEVPNSFRRVL